MTESKNTYLPEQGEIDRTKIKAEYERGRSALQTQRKTTFQ